MRTFTDRAANDPVNRDMGATMTNACPLTIGSMTMREFFDLCVIQFTRSRTVDKLGRVDPFERHADFIKCIALECFYRVGLFSNQHVYPHPEYHGRVLALAEMNRQAGMSDERVRALAEQFHDGAMRQRPSRSPFGSGR